MRINRSVNRRVIFQAPIIITYFPFSFEEFLNFLLVLKEKTKDQEKYTDITIEVRKKNSYLRKEI